MECFVSFQIQHFEKLAIDSQFVFLGASKARLRFISLYWSLCRKQLGGHWNIMRHTIWYGILLIIMIMMIIIAIMIVLIMMIMIGHDHDDRYPESAELSILDDEKYMIALSYTLNNKAADDLAIQEARASADMVFTSFSRNIPDLAQERIISALIGRYCPGRIREFILGSVSTWVSP